MTSAYDPRLPVPPSPEARVGAGLLAVVMLGGAVWLSIRPLSTLLVLLCALGAGLIVGGVMLAVRPPRRRGGAAGEGAAREASGKRMPRLAAVPLGAVLVAAGAATLWFLPEVGRRLPWVLAAALVLAAAWQLWRTVSGGTPTRRAVHIAWAVAALSFVPLTLWWPDAMLIVLAAVFNVSLVVTAVRLAVWALKRRRHPDLIRRDLARGDLRATRYLHTRRRGATAPGAIAASGVAAVTVFALAVAGVIASQPLRAAVPVPSDFYEWSGAIPSEPGSLLRTAPYEGYAPEGSTAQRMLYVTSNEQGTPVVASAVIAVPTAPPSEASAGRTVLAWDHGTSGVTTACAPSLGSGALADWAIPGASRAIASGWAVVATDYPGQGVEGDYPYLIGEGEGRATLDAVRALTQVQGSAASDRVMLWGHSQGGHASLWAGQLAPSYAPELDVLGVAALSAAADPLALAQNVLGEHGNPAAAVITSFVLVPYVNSYAQLEMRDVAHAAGGAFADAYASRCIDDPATALSALTNASFTFDAPLFSIDLASGPVRDRLAANAASGAVDAPLFLGQGTADQVIPLQVQRDTFARACAAGVPVTAREYEGKGHLDVLTEGSALPADLLAWTQAVIAGGAPSDCAGN